VCSTTYTLDTPSSHLFRETDGPPRGGSGAPAAPGSLLALDLPSSDEEDDEDFAAQGAAASSSASSACLLLVQEGAACMLPGTGIAEQGAVAPLLCCVIMCILWHRCALTTRACSHSSGSTRCTVCSPWPLQRPPPMQQSRAACLVIQPGAQRRSIPLATWSSTAAAAAAAAQGAV
jgi:hypothetical protein